MLGWGRLFFARLPTTVALWRPHPDPSCQRPPGSAHVPYADGVWARIWPEPSSPGAALRRVVRSCPALCLTSWSRRHSLLRIVKMIGSSASLVKEELIKSALFSVIRSWGHTDLFSILLLQTLSPKSRKSQHMLHRAQMSCRLLLFSMVNRLKVQLIPRDAQRDKLK